MINGFLFRAFACIFVPYLMMASSVESYASDEDLVGKVKSEGACDDGFFNVWNIAVRRNYYHNVSCSTASVSGTLTGSVG